MSNQTLNYIVPVTRNELARELNDSGPAAGDSFQPNQRKGGNICRHFGFWLMRNHPEEFTRRYLAWKAAAEAQT